MAGVNKIILLGNLGKDPELRTTKSGTSVCNFSLAVSEKQKSKTGEYVDVTEWVRVVVFGKQADNAAKYLSKGRQVYLEGRLQTSKYTDREGVERYSTEVIANTVNFLGGSKPAEPEEPKKAVTKRRAKKAA